MASHGAGYTTRVPVTSASWHAITHNGRSQMWKGSVNRQLGVQRRGWCFKCAGGSWYSFQVARGSEVHASSSGEGLSKLKGIGRYRRPVALPRQKLAEEKIHSRYSQRPKSNVNENE